MQRELIERLIAQQGNVVAAAATLSVAVSTLHRWRDGSRPLQGVALVAVEAVLAHPKDYKSFTKLVRPAHRPATLF